MASPTTVRADLPVLVAGGGPVGMTAAALLAQQGHPVTVMEAEPEVRTDWRASTFHAATLELLERIDITGQMLAAGLAVPVYQYRDRRDGKVAEFDFGLLADETPYPYRLQLNQQHLVRMLCARLSKHELVTLSFGTRVTGLADDPEGVTVTVASPEGTRTVRGSHLIGADGAASTVRRLLDVEFEGYTYPERFLIVSTSSDLQALVPDLAHVNYVADPREWLFILHTPESWRVVLPVPAGQPAEVATSHETLRARLQSLAANPAGYDILDCQLYSVHQRVAATFRVGKVALVGDAAHINSPLGGVGLNSGIHDAIDVAMRLDRIRRGTGDLDAELDMFARLRRTVAVEYVQADTARNTARMQETDARRRAADRSEMRAIAADPQRARAWMRRVSLLESVRRLGIGAPPAA